MALGAQRGDILALVVGQGAALIAAGAVAGVFAAAASSRVLESFLFGVTTDDRLTFVAAPLVLVAVALVARLAAGAPGEPDRSDAGPPRRVAGRPGRLCHPALPLCSRLPCCSVLGARALITRRFCQQRGHTPRLPARRARALEQIGSVCTGIRRRRSCIGRPAAGRPASRCTRRHCRNPTQRHGGRSCRRCRRTPDGSRRGRGERRRLLRAACWRRRGRAVLPLDRRQDVGFAGPPLGILESRQRCGRPCGRKERRSETRTERTHEAR